MTCFTSEDILNVVEVITGAATFALVLTIFFMVIMTHVNKHHKRQQARKINQLLIKELDEIPTRTFKLGKTHDNNK